ncbi:MAG: hypothetical protein AAB515_01530 [Patescibacteria group bacterium]
MIHTTIWQSKKVTDLRPQERLLYIGLITFADDDGRFRADPSLIRANVFPREKYGITRVQKMINVIEKSALITLYEVDGERYGFHPNWMKYQIIRSDRRKTSYIPAPMTTIPQPDANQTSTKGNEIKSNSISLARKQMLNGLEKYDALKEGQEG